MQEELKEIEILTFIYKMLKEKAEKRVNKYGATIYRCDDSNMFELYVDILEDEQEGDEEFWIGDKRVDKKTLKLIKEKLNTPTFYCRKNNTCENQCPLCTGGENK